MRMKKSRHLTYFLLTGIAAILLLASCHSGKKAAKSKAIAASPQRTYTVVPNPPPSTRKQRKSKAPSPNNQTEDRESGIVSKYSTKLGVSKGDITNYNLYNFIDLWYGTPYKYAGRTKSGVDCSDLASLLFQAVYNISIGGNVTDIYNRCKPIKESDLREGDLIFFKINSKSLSHVAIYLQNHKFVHASVHSGVTIDDLGEDYYKKYYWGAGRLLR